MVWFGSVMFLVIPGKIMKIKEALEKLDEGRFR